VGQVFIAHRGLVNGLLRDFADGVYRPLLIDFPSFTPTDDSRASSLKEVAKGLFTVLEGLKHALVIKYENDFPSLPTLAGLLLSYPVLYCSEDPMAKLLDAEVDVYSIYTDSAAHQTVLQFSGPASFREVISKDLAKLADDWNRRLYHLTPELSKRWTDYTGVESSCILKTHIETRRVSVLTL